MTLVAAYRSNDGGILLCADREEDDSYAKRSVDKIYTIYSHSCNLYLAGAGLSNSISKANEEIHNGVRQIFASGKDVLQEHKKIIENGLNSVYEEFGEDYFAQMPMNFLIVISPKAPNSAPLLYRTDGWHVFPEHDYAAFGSGKLICDYFSDRLYEYPRLGKPNLLALAAFIFREAHKSASGVGDDVDMIFLRPTPAFGETHELGPDAVKELQSGIPPLSEAIWGYWKEHAKIPDWTAK